MTQYSHSHLFDLVDLSNGYQWSMRTARQSIDTIHKSKISHPVIKAIAHFELFHLANELFCEFVVD